LQQNCRLLQLQRQQFSAKRSRLLFADLLPLLAAKPPLSQAQGALLSRLA
jgi:hypothetical protein